MELRHTVVQLVLLNPPHLLEMFFFLQFFAKIENEDFLHRYILCSFKCKIGNVNCLVYIFEFLKSVHTYLSIAVEILDYILFLSSPTAS